MIFGAQWCVICQKNSGGVHYWCSKDFTITQYTAELSSVKVVTITLGHPVSSTHPSFSLFLPFPSILMTSSCRFCLGWPWKCEHTAEIYTPPPCRRRLYRRRGVAPPSPDERTPLLLQSPRLKLCTEWRAESISYRHATNSLFKA